MNKTMVTNRYILLIINEINFYNNASQLNYISK